MLIHTTSLAETAVTGNLLPNAGTGQTNVQHSDSTIDGINNSNNWSLDNITDYSSNFNELEANGTGTVSASGSLLGISAGEHTTTEDSLDGGVRLDSTTEVQNCEWTGSAHRCGQATQGQDSYSTTVTILDENDGELATITQNRNTDSGYYNNTHTYTDTVIHTGEGARKWEWQWRGVDGDSPNSTSPVGPNLLGADLKATLLDILYSPIPPAIQTEIVEIFEELDEEFQEIEQIVEEFLFEEEISITEEPIEMGEPVMVMMEIKEEESFEEPALFEETIVIEEKPKKEEKPAIEMFTEILNEESTEEEEPTMQMFTEILNEENEEEENLDNSTEEGIIEVVEKESTKEEKNEEPEEITEEESNSETTETANASEESNTKQKSLQSKENKTANAKSQSGNLELEKVISKIDEKVKDIGKNLELKNLVTLKAMSNNDILLSAYNVPFYKPKNIYLDQIDISDNRDIYTDVTLNTYTAKDPIAIKVKKINKLKIERQQLLIQLEVLKNG